MSQKFRGIQCPIVVLGETCKWGGSMKAVCQDSACDISLVRLMYSVMPHPSLKESHLQEHENHVGEPSTIQASSSKRVKISKALSTLIPGRSSKTCLWGSGLEFPKHELPDQRSCLIKGVDPCRFLTHGCPDFWLTNQVYFFTMLPKHHTEASYLHYIDKYAVCSWSTSWIHSFQAELKPKSES